MSRSVGNWLVRLVFACLAVIYLGTHAATLGWCAPELRGRQPAGAGVASPFPKRIVSLAPSITEIVFALGKGDCLVGVTELCDFPAEAARLPRIGAFLHPDFERIVSLAPDLCLAVKDENLPDGMERLRAFGIPAVVINPKSLDSVADAIRQIGRLLDAQTRAEDLAVEMEMRIERVKSRVAKASARPRVFFQIGISPIVSAGSRTFIDELITTAGGHNLAEGPTPYPRFSIEQVLTLEPDVILVTSMARGQAFEPILNAWREWESVPAVKNERIFLVDSNLFDRPTARLVEGLEILARLIHPELY